MDTKKTNKDKNHETIDENSELTCGIVMPISSIDGCSESHWSDVLEILTETIEESGFKAQLVSFGDDIGVIQKRIIQNLYDNPIVICDVSGKNPNVMFELGIRLAFDKPTIIVKDDKTTYSFDTSPIEHLEYPRDLRFNKIVEFKESLLEKIKKTYERSVNDKEYSTFLKHFGEFKVSKINKKEVPEMEILLEEFRSLRNIVLRDSSTKSIQKEIDFDLGGLVEICIHDVDEIKAKEIHDYIISTVSIKKSTLKTINPKHFHIKFIPKDSNFEYKSFKSSLIKQYMEIRSVRIQK
jgi:hypothetical protein